MHKYRCRMFLSILEWSMQMARCLLLELSWWRSCVCVCVCVCVCMCVYVFLCINVHGVCVCVCVCVGLHMCLQLEGDLYQSESFISLVHLWTHLPRDNQTLCVGDAQR